MPTEGQVAINKQTGQQAVFKGGNWVVTPQAPAEASMRSRLGLGLGPMVQSEQTMGSMERGGNPLQRNFGIPAALDSVADTEIFGMKPAAFLGPAAAFVGGQPYQDYKQAAKTYESQLMPIMSGAAVSPSEAERQVKAALPEFRDTTETLGSKSRTRKMMLNGAAKQMGAPLPYPEVETYGVNSTKLPQSMPDRRKQQNDALKAKSAAKPTAKGSFKFLGYD